MWTGENDTKTISVDANLFENGAKKLRFRLKTSECGQGLNSEYIVNILGRFLFFFLCYCCPC